MRRPAWITQIEALGWDLDGTLYPTSQALTTIIHHKQYEAVSVRMGWGRERTLKEYGKRYRQLGSNTKTLNSFGIDGLSFFSSVWDEIELDRFIKQDRRLVRLFTSLVSWRQFLISNSNRIDQMNTKLELIGLKPSLFEFIVSTVDLGAVKPDPAPFLKALETLELAPEQVMFIGDRESTDILGARGVGMRTCLVWGKSKAADISLPTVYDVGVLFFNSKGKRQKAKLQLKR